MEYKLIFFVFVSFLFLNNPEKRKHISPSIGHGHMPAMVVDKRGIVHAVYGNGDSLMYTYSADKGQTFIAPKLAAIVHGLISTATRGPQVEATDNGVAVIATTNSGSVFSCVSTEKNGWAKPVKVSDADSVNLEGFADIGSDGHSNLFAAWLDLRGNRRNKIYGARSDDGGRTWSSNMEIYTSPDTTVCECCRISVAMDGKKVYVMFRNWLDGNRDMYITQSKDAGKTFDTPHKLGNGSWALKGCPMDGGGISIKDGVAQTVWRRQNTIYSCVDGAMELPIGEGRSCTIATAHGTNAYAWINQGTVVCKVGNSPLQSLGQGSSPVITAVDNHSIICLWEDNGEIRKELVKY